MIETASKKVQINQIVKSQLPSFVSEENPLFVDFLKQSYIAQEFQGGPIDIISNLNEYQKVETYSGNDRLIGFTTCTSAVTSFDTTINVTSTTGWPEKYGLLKINDEIITYTGITTNSFTGCIRGFSGVESLHKSNQTESLVFSQTEADSHISSSRVVNLSNLFLQEFWKKTKTQFLPGFEDRTLSNAVDKANFLRQAKDFYSSKGTDEAVKILFNVLYNQRAEVIKPIEYLIAPSDADYVVTYDLVAELIDGNPLNVIGQTLYQTTNPEVSGAIFNVQSYPKNNKPYYLISLSVNSIIRKFEVTGSSALTESVSIGSTVLSVDSTLGFENSGSFYVGTGQTVGVATYTSKSSTQFFGVSGITSAYTDGELVRSSNTVVSYENGDITKPVYFRLTSVVSNANIDEVSSLVANDKLKARGLGNISSPTNYRLNSWVHNLKTKSHVAKNIETNTSVIDVASNTITTVSPHLLYIDDSVTILDKSSAVPLNVNGIVSQVISPTQFKITITSGSLNVSRTYTVRKNLNRASSNSSFIKISDYTSNVQNTYSDLDGNNVYVASGSLPSYRVYATDRRKSFTPANISGNTITINNHGFYNGDLVTYSPVSMGTSSVVGLSTGSIYAVTRISENEIKLSSSPFDASLKRFLSISGGGSSHRLIPSELNNNQLQHQNFLREFPVTPQLKENNNLLEKENIGMFLNGVEIVSNKSGDEIYYGDVSNIDVENSGNGYDVINPPNINITDSVGSGATAFAVIENGSFKSIEVTYRGYDLKTIPSITITGGNGSGATASSRLRAVRNAKTFNADLNVSTSDNTVGFSTYHLFYNGESVVYEKAVGYAAVGGLVDKSIYYVNKVSDTHVKLMNTYDDALAGINTINLSSKSAGVNILTSTTFRNALDRVVIDTPGSGYSNRKISLRSSIYPPADYTTVNDVRSGINTANDYIFFKSHGFSTGDLVEYKTTGTAISGLTTTQNYYVYAIDNDKFYVTSAGIGTTSSTSQFDKKQFIDLKSVGVGTHTFKYPDISVSMDVISGTANTAISLPRVRPVCTGNIVDVQLTSTGSGYGVRDTFNVHRRPSVTVSNGSGALIDVVITNGEIVQAFVKIEGKGYVSPPTLEVVGDGKYAKLVATVAGGKVTGVTIVDSGKGYTQRNTTVRVTPVGSGAKFRADVRKWEVDLVQKYKSSISENDDGLIVSSQNSNYGNKYVHAYLSRKLRLLLNDNIEDNLSEKTTLSHSPIVGWAYDGSPIYGPYGFDSPTGGIVRRLKPSYTLSTKSNRPLTSVYPLGFFVNDWDYTADQDLDEYNGRFCKTPEFPDGIYAYFCTIESSDSSTAPFTNSREPLYPYVLNGYKFKVNEFNQNPNSIQNLPILNSGSVVRNTYPYKFGLAASGYDYLVRNNLEDTEVTVRSINKVGISSVTVLVPGDGYNVDDRIIFDNTNSGGDAASAKIKTIVGKGIDFISYAKYEVLNVAFSLDNQIVTGIATSAHNLSNNDLVVINGISNGELKFIEGPRTVSVSSVTSRLDVGIGTSGATGIVTTITLANSGASPEIYVNDTVGIGSEKLTVLSVDSTNNKYRVRRQAGVLTSHSAGETLFVDQKRFKFTVGIKTDLKTNINRTLVFNPQNSIGIGTTVLVQSVAGVGTTTVVRVKAFDGSILSDHRLPPSGSTADNSISIINHGLSSGDKLTYSPGPTGVALTVSNNLDLTNSFNLIDGQTVFAVKQGNNLLGITTTQTGIGSTSTSLYFLPVWQNNGVEHSFTTNGTEYIGSVKRFDVTVKTSADHTLNTNDNVVVNVKPNTTLSKSIEYDTNSRKTILDPTYFATSAVGVGTTNSQISIDNHGYSSGDKILYISNNPITPLINRGEYFVQKLNDDQFRLSTSYVDSTKFGGSYIGITSFGSGVHKIAKINPHVTATRGQTIGFAVSDFSLQNFKLEFFEDENFENRYEGFGISTEVTRTGSPGQSGALVKLKLSDNVPSPLFYKLTPRNLGSIFVEKRDAEPDNTVSNGSKIIIEPSVFSGSHSITTTSNLRYKYQVTREPEISTYTTSGITTYSYITDSLVARGGINEIKVTFGGINYLRNPGISTVNTSFGRNAILSVHGGTVGSPGSREITKLGFDYPSDKSIKPKIDTPTIVTVTNNYILSSVGVVTAGKNYIVPPQLIIPDAPDIELVANIEGTSVSSVDVTRIGRGFNSVPNPPNIIPIRNTNGVGIVSASSSGTTNFLTLKQPINGWRSDGEDFPFVVGDRIFVEGIGLTTSLSSTGGYNSEDYNYAFFTVATRNPSASQITYSISGIGTFGGIFDPDQSAGRVIKQSDLPTFSAVLTPEQFFSGEKVTYGANGKAFVLDNFGYDATTSTIRLRSVSPNISIGNVIKGSVSGAEGTVSSVKSFDVYYDLDYSSERPKGWQRDTGKLNDDFQKLEDNDYYQNFSYSIKSQVQESQWKDAVDSIIHPSGYKNFSDLIVSSTATAGFGRSSTLNLGQPIGDTTLSVNIDNVKSFYRRDDFDYASEEVLNNGLSKYINLQNKRISSFINIKSNIVNFIDDISDQFTGIGTTTTTQIVGLTTFKLTDNSFVLFTKVFDGSDSNVVSAGSSIIRINNHNFQTGEKIKYDPGNEIYGNNRIGIVTTNNVVGGISTNFMPSEVYAIKIDNNQFSLAGLNTAVTNNEPFTFRSVGSGTSHSFDTINPDNRVMISIDGIVQSPLFKKNVDVSLSEAIGIGSTTIKVVGITSITTNDLLNIDNEILQIGVVGFGSTNVLTVNRGVLGSVAAAHTVGAAVTMRGGDFHIVKDVLHFITAPYGPIGSSSLQPGIGTQSTFAGRVFNRTNPTTNFVFDDLSDKFTGIGKTFTLLQDNQDVTGIVTTISSDGGGSDEVVNNGIILINNIVQRPIVDFNMDERTSPGIGASIFFTGTSETNLPRGGKVGEVTVGFGSGYQNLVAAAATAIINGAGSIESVVVTGGGSGYRSSNSVDIQVLNPLGIGSTAVLSATVGSAGTITGITTVSGGSGYASTNPPIIVVGIPTGYNSLEFTGGQGRDFRASVVVGTGGSIIDFNITDSGFGYANGDVLTVTGIPTDPNVGAAFSAFTFTVNSRVDDKFSGFSFGQLLPLDSFADQFDGNQTVFTLTRTTVTREIINIDSDDTSVRPANNLLIFLNDVLQQPGENYIFNGGTQVEFTEAPKAGSKLSILFFRGSNADVNSGTPFPTVKVGDKLTLERQGNTVQQLDRRVTEITGVRKAETNLYGGRGINQSASFVRMVSWEKQTSDLILDNQALSKARTSLIAKIQPTTRIIQNVGVGSQVIFVENAFPLFSAYDNRTDKNSLLGGSLKIIKNVTVDRADATATVSTGGVISSVTVTDPGAGYDTVPTVSFASTVEQIKEIGRTWTQTSSNTDVEYQSVNYTDFNVFIAVGSTSGINTSTDGVTWSDSGVSGFGNFNDVVGLTTNVIAVGVGGTIAVSLNRGSTYVPSTIYTRTLNGFLYSYADTTIPQDLNSVAAGPTKVVAVGAGGTILFSENGTSGFGTAFVIGNKYSSQNLRGVSNNANTFIAVGDNGALLRSVGGEIWSGVTTTSVTTRLNDVHYGDNKWVAVGAAGTIISSTDDGRTWSVVSSGSTFNLNSVIYQDNVWVAIGQSGNVLNSVDSNSWYKKFVGVGTDYNGLAYGNNKLVTVGLSSNIAYSQFAKVSAAATATVSAAGTISSINLSDGGFGYDPNEPIEVLISVESVVTEILTSVDCDGDFGTVIGVGTSATGIGTDSPMVKFELNSDPFLDQAAFGNIVRSGIASGYYFVIHDSVVGNGLTSINTDGTAIGIGTSFMDNVYRASEVISSSSGIVTVYSNVESLAGLGTTSLSPRLGYYSWGRFYGFNRSVTSPKSFTINNQNGYTGLTTAPIVYRITPVVENYSDFDQTS